MAEGYNDFRNPRLADAARRLWGEDLVLDTFSPELMPAVVLENDRFENRFPQLIRYWTTGFITVAASAGNQSRLQIHNPPTSGQIVVVEGFLVLNPLTVNSYIVTRDGALAGTPTANLATDTRVPVATASRRVASLNRIDNSLPAPSGETMARRTSVVGVDVFFNFRQGPENPIVLIPNSVCEIINGTVNSIFQGFGFGYERPARAEELAIA